MKVRQMCGNLKHVFAVGDEEQSEADTRAASQVCADSLTSYTHSGRKNLCNLFRFTCLKMLSFFLFNLK